MAKEEISLPVEMGKLEIESVKMVKIVTDSCPYLQQNVCIFNKSSLQNFKCSNCTSKTNLRNITISKKKSNNIIKEPVLKLLKNYKSIKCVVKETQTKDSINLKVLECSPTTDNINLCDLVNDCNQLRISPSTSCKLKTAAADLKNDCKWWLKSVSNVKDSKESSSEKNHTGPSCSQQALNPPCDITIDELASYFDTLVHIPRKMSSMAEMMYI